MEKYSVLIFLILSLVSGALPLREAPFYALSVSMVFSIVFGYLLVERHKNKKTSFKRLAQNVIAVNAWLIFLPQIHYYVHYTWLKLNFIALPPDDIGPALASVAGMIFFCFFSALFIGFAYLNIKRYGLDPVITRNIDPDDRRQRPLP